MNLFKKFLDLNWKNKAKVTLAIVTIVFLLIGSTFAYFQSLDSSPLNVPTTLNTTTADSLVFEVGNQLSITADILSFASGKGNQTSESYVNATLRANSNTKYAEDNYNIYLDVSQNEFVYSTTGSKPEILLRITNPQNQVMSSALDGVIYKSVVDGTNRTVSGYDITAFKGLLPITENYGISTTWREIQKWKFELIFVNLSDNQSRNGGKNFSADIRVRKMEIPYNTRCSGTFACDIAKLYTGVQGSNGLYYHNRDLVNGANDISYRYAGANPNNYVCFGYDDPDKTYASNWCPNENLYRIIGVFGNQVKLIKYDYAKSATLGTGGDYGGTGNSIYGTSKGSNVKSELGAYYWNYSSTTNSKNIWSESRLNKTNLNSTLINSLGSTWTNKIATMNWKVGGNTWANIYLNAATAYKNEVISPATSTIYNARIGLMYVSDYMYGASPNAWLLTANNYNSTTAKNSNWMYMGLREWMITRRFDNEIAAYYINNDGAVSTSNIYSSTYGVRPVFYLNTTVKKTGGTGTASDPYRVN